MRNRKLYKSIQTLIQRKKDESNNEKISGENVEMKKQQKKIFVQKYCHEQMKKKRLIPKNHSSKINEIMKNFQQIQTYVNVEDLVECINQIHAQQLKQQKNGIEINNIQINSLYIECSKAEQDNTQDLKIKIQSLLRKAHQHIQLQLKQKSQIQGSPKPSNQNYKYDGVDSENTQNLTTNLFAKSKEQSKIQQIMNYLEKQSLNVNHQINNRQQNIVLSQYQRQEKQNRNIPHKNQNTNISKNQISKTSTVFQPWNRYSKLSCPEQLFSKSNQNTQQFQLIKGLNYTTDPFSVLCEIGKIGGGKNKFSLKSDHEEAFSMNKKKREMLKLARIYLHMILENEHKKKWDPTYKQKQSKNNQFDINFSRIKGSTDEKEHRNSASQATVMNSTIVNSENRNHKEYKFKTINQNYSDKENITPENQSEQLFKMTGNPFESKDSTENSYKTKKISTLVSQQCSNYQRKQFFKNFKTYTQTEEIVSRKVKKNNPIRQQQRQLSKKKSHIVRKNTIRNINFVKSDSNDPLELYHSKVIRDKNIRKLSGKKLLHTLNKNYNGNSSISQALRQVRIFLQTLEEDEHQIHKQIEQDLKNIEYIEKKLSQNQKYTKNLSQYTKMKQNEGQNDERGFKKYESPLMIWEDDQKLQKIKQMLIKQQNSQQIRARYRNNC